MCWRFLVGIHGCPSKILMSPTTHISTGKFGYKLRGSTLCVCTSMYLHVVFIIYIYMCVIYVIYVIYGIYVQTTFKQPVFFQDYPATLPPNHPSCEVRNSCRGWNCDCLGNVSSPFLRFAWFCGWGVPVRVKKKRVCHTWLVCKNL